MTTTDDLTTRYVERAMSTVPEGRRADIDAELRSSIDDMVGERIASGEEPDAAERDVLNELGDPEVLADRYIDRPAYLIGPRYYRTWRGTLVSLLTTVPLVLAFIVAAVGVLDGDGFAATMGSAIETGFTAALHVAVWTTLAYAILDRTGRTPKEEPWTVDRLPARAPEREITVGETITGIATALVMAGFLIGQHFLSGVTRDGERLPVLDPDLWSGWLPLLVAILLGYAAFEIVKHRVGHWTLRLAITNLVLGAAFAIPTIWLLVTDRLFNADYLTAVDASPTTIDQATTAISVGIALVIAWDAGEGLVKALRRR